MKTIAVYNPKGEITKVVQCPEFLFQAQTGVGESSIPFDPDWDPNAFYVYRGKLHRRQAFSWEARVPVDGSLRVIIEGLPPGAIVEVKGAKLVVDDQPTELEFDISGTYDIRLGGLAAYLPETITLQVGESTNG